jgi:O-antigen/teichoic acid export membrane protein
MGAEARVALRNTGFVVAQQIAQVVSGLLFAVLVVRAMGPEMYGRYAVLTALLVWFFLLSGLGFNQVIGRYVPGFVLAGDRVGLTGFLGSALGVRLLSAAAAAGLYLASRCRGCATWIGWRWH